MLQVPDPKQEEIEQTPMAPTAPVIKGITPNHPHPPISPVAAKTINTDPPITRTARATTRSFNFT